MAQQIVQWDFSLIWNFCLQTDKKFMRDCLDESPPLMANLFCSNFVLFLLLGLPIYWLGNARPLSFVWDRSKLSMFQRELVARARWGGTARSFCYLQPSECTTPSKCCEIQKPFIRFGELAIAVHHLLVPQVYFDCGERKRSSILQVPLSLSSQQSTGAVGETPLSRPSKQRFWFIRTAVM